MLTVEKYLICNLEQIWSDYKSELYPIFVTDG